MEKSCAKDDSGLRTHDETSKKIQPRVSIIIPVLNEEEHIGPCLDSIIMNTYPKEKLEILVIDGGSSDSTLNIINEYCRRYPFIRCLQNPKKIQSAALNIGIAHATGDYILRMDAHARYDSGYIQTCIDKLITTRATNVGGVQTAIGKNYIGSAIALALSSPFGVGDARFRYTKKEMWAESVYLGAWHRSTLIKVGGFNEDWAVNEDFELNHRLRKQGGKILVSPDIQCQYIVRSTLPAFMRQYFRYGFWRARTLITYPDSLRWRILAPPLLVIGLLVSIFLLPFSPWLALVIPLLYGTTNLISSLIISVKNGLRYFLILPLVFTVLHVSWGSGFLIGLFYWSFRALHLRFFSGYPSKNS